MMGIMTLLFLVSSLFSSHRTHFEYTARLSALKRHPFYHTLQRRPPRPAAAQVPYHHNTIPPHHHTPIPASRPDATPAATSARVVAGPPPTLATALTRRVDVRTPPRRRPDTATPLAVLVCRTRLPYPLVAGTPRTKSVSQAQATCDTLRTARLITRRPAGLQARL